MPYRYLEHTADALFEAWGETREELFSAAADALLNVMVEDLATVAAKEEIPLRVEHEEMDLLLFAYLIRCLLEYMEGKPVQQVAETAGEEGSRPMTEEQVQQMLTGAVARFEEWLRELEARIAAGANKASGPNG